VPQSSLAVVRALWPMKPLFAMDLVSLSMYFKIAYCAAGS